MIQCLIFFYFNYVNSSSLASLSVESPVSQPSLHNDIAFTSETLISLQNSPVSHSVSDSAFSVSLHFANLNSNLRKSIKVKHTPKYLEAYQVNLPSSISHVTTYPITHYLFSNQLSPKYKAFISALSQTFEPSSYNQAVT